MDSDTLTLTARLSGARLAGLLVSLTSLRSDERSPAWCWAQLRAVVPGAAHEAWCDALQAVGALPDLPADVIAGGLALRPLGRALGQLLPLDEVVLLMTVLVNAARLSAQMNGLNRSRAS